MKTILDLEDLRKGCTCISEAVFAKFRRNFCLKVVQKSSPSARFLTKKLFFTFDFRMLNFAFLSPRNEIWKLLVVFLKLPNALDAKYASILKNWILPLNASFLLVLSHSEPHARWDLSYGGRFTSAIKLGAVPQVSETFSEMPKVIMKHILEPSSIWNSPWGFVSQWRSCTVEISP